MSHHIILISCSDGKNRGGEPDYNADHSLTALLPPDVQQPLWQCRRTIAELIMAGQVEDRLRGDGNRRDSRYNIELALGPDIGINPAETEPPVVSYLPAYQRYDGRFFAHAGQEAFEQAILEDYHVLIVSGLYGLLLPEEPIQAYNCHLDDEILETCSAAPEVHQTGSLMASQTVDPDLSNDPPSRISEIWQQSRLPDRILQAFIQWHDQAHDHAIEHVVDVLSETSYQRLFHWNALYPWFKRRRITWWHRRVQGVREPDFLADLGRWFRYDWVEKGAAAPSSGKVIRDYLHTINAAGGHLAFTREIQPEPYTASRLQRELGDATWHRMERRTQEDLIHGELFFQLYDARSSRRPDEIAPRIVNFFSALENELHQICYETAGKGSLGGFAWHLCEGRLAGVWASEDQKQAVCTVLARLLAVRNRMSHRGVVTRGELLEARTAIVQRDGVLAAVVRVKRAGRANTSVTGGIPP